MKFFKALSTHSLRSCTMRARLITGQTFHYLYTWHITISNLVIEMQKYVICSYSFLRNPLWLVDCSLETLVILPEILGLRNQNLFCEYWSDLNVSELIQNSLNSCSEPQMKLIHFSSSQNLHDLKIRLIFVSDVWKDLWYSWHPSLTESLDMNRKMCHHQ